MSIVLTGFNRAHLALLCLTLLRCDSAQTANPKFLSSDNDAATPEGLVVFVRPQGDLTVRVEVADDPTERKQGLMHRQSLDEFAGMIFVFPDEAIRSFWMKNTYIPLDMIFVDASAKIVGIVPRAEPQTTAPRTVSQPAQFVIEVNGGFTEAYQIDTNTRLRFENIPTSTKF